MQNGDQVTQRLQNLTNRINTGRTIRYNFNNAALGYARNRGVLQNDGVRYQPEAGESDVSSGEWDTLSGASSISNQSHPQLPARQLGGPVINSTATARVRDWNHEPPEGGYDPIPDDQANPPEFAEGVDPSDNISLGESAGAATATSEATEAAAGAAESAGTELAASSALGPIGAIAGATLGIGTLISSLVSPVIQEHQQEKYAKFSYNLAKTQASDTGMPLANILGAGGQLPQRSQVTGVGSSVTTSGQGYSMPHFNLGGQSQFQNGYIDF